ncbi:hypothetical protein CCHR01_18719 [Colletotrichum chrysophilum]|uniref:Uncharacterized protein n=1 Tax=Colletotrichum chrysophilum TaxID=1836956 RepID=A0AAD9E5S6_9PEZI|nr:hypothetical protein CCHR01_18719 [Colletotrichum chrysophilum]
MDLEQRGGTEPAAATGKRKENTVEAKVRAGRPARRHEACRSRPVRIRTGPARDMCLSVYLTLVTNNNNNNTTPLARTNQPKETRPCRCQCLLRR